MPLRKRIAAAVLAMIAVWFVQQQGWSLPSVEPVTEPPKIAIDGVSVLIAEQDSESGRLTQDQRDIIAGYIWSEKVPEGNWRVVDTDSEFTTDSPFKPVFERRPKDALPWCVISGPGRQYEGPLPATPVEMVQLVEGAANG